MNVNTWWSALGGALGVVLTALIIAALGRSRERATPDADSRLSHPPGLLWIGVLCFALFAGLAIVSNLFANSTTTWWTTLVFVALALLGALLIVEYWRVDHAMDDSGLHYRGLFVPRFTLPWQEIQSVRYSTLARWFVLRSSRGKTARISILLRGLPAFARRVLHDAPNAALDAPTRALLREIAQGRLPPLA